MKSSAQMVTILCDILASGSAKYGADDPPRHSADHFINKAMRHILRHQVAEEQRIPVRGLHDTFHIHPARIYDNESGRLHLLHAAADLILAACFFDDNKQE